MANNFIPVLSTRTYKKDISKSDFSKEIFYKIDTLPEKYIVTDLDMNSCCIDVSKIVGVVQTETNYPYQIQKVSILNTPMGRICQKYLNANKNQSIDLKIIGTGEDKSDADNFEFIAYKVDMKIVDNSEKK